MKKRHFFLFFLGILMLASCSDYQKLLKNPDAELKYSKAVEYFEKGDYARAVTLFDDVSTYFRGTSRSEDLLNYLAKCYMGQKDYVTACEYYKAYVKSYSTGKYIEEARFMVGYCYYLDSPDPRLDQTSTYNALSAFQEFLDFYPESKRVPEVNKLIDKLNDKLAYKYYLNAKLYYNLGNYMGNNYLSAVITAENALKKYPLNSYREDLMFLILESKYAQAVQSIPDKKIERYQNTVDEYYNYINEFPEGKYKKQADKIFNESKKVINY